MRAPRQQYPGIQPGPGPWQALVHISVGLVHPGGGGVKSDSVFGDIQQWIKTQDLGQAVCELIWISKQL